MDGRQHRFRRSADSTARTRCARCAGLAGAAGLDEPAHHRRLEIAAVCCQPVDGDLPAGGCDGDSAPRARCGVSAALRSLSTGDAVAGRVSHASSSSEIQQRVPDPVQTASRRPGVAASVFGFVIFGPPPWRGPVHSDGARGEANVRSVLGSPPLSASRCLRVWEIHSRRSVGLGLLVSFACLGEVRIVVERVLWGAAVGAAARVGFCAGGPAVDAPPAGLTQVMRISVLDLRPARFALAGPDRLGCGEEVAAGAVLVCGLAVVAGGSPEGSVAAAILWNQCRRSRRVRVGQSRC